MWMSQDVADDVVLVETVFTNSSFYSFAIAVLFSTPLIISCYLNFPRIDRSYKGENIA